jgi:hypothetical protein
MWGLAVKDLLWNKLLEQDANDEGFYMMFTLVSVNALISSYFNSFDFEVKGTEVLMIDTSLCFERDLFCS